PDFRLVAEANGFALPIGGSGVASLDGRVRVTGSADRSGVTAAAVVEKGALRLPTLTSGRRQLQGTAPLEDVEFVDERGRRDERRRAQARRRESGIEASVALSVPGPFHVHGPE